MVDLNADLRMAVIIADCAQLYQQHSVDNEHCQKLEACCKQVVAGHRD